MGLTGDSSRLPASSRVGGVQEQTKAEAGLRTARRPGGAGAEQRSSGAAGGEVVTKEAGWGVGGWSSPSLEGKKRLEFILPGGVGRQWRDWV